MQWEVYNHIHCLILLQQITVFPAGETESSLEYRDSVYTVTLLLLFPIKVYLEIHFPLILPLGNDRETDGAHNKLMLCGLKSLGATLLFFLLFHAYKLRLWK